MRNKILSQLLTYCQNQKPITNKQQYGMECLIILIEKTLFLIFFAILCNLLMDVCYLLLFFIPLKAISFGKHFQTSITCTFFSIAVFLLTAFICANFFHQAYYFLFFPASIFIIIVPKNINQRQIKKTTYQIILILLLTLYSILIIKQHYLSNYIIGATILQAFLLTNIIFRRKEVL